MSITATYTEKNPIVADGTHIRVYVRELEVGDVDPFGAVVVSVTPAFGLSGAAKVEWDNDGVTSAFYRRPDATVLIRTK